MIVFSKKFEKFLHITRAKSFDIINKFNDENTFIDDENADDGPPERFESDDALVVFFVCFVRHETKSEPEAFAE
jgi:hypothetical protein